MRCVLSILGMLLLYAINGQNTHCNGNLGENIFVSGDFGSGNANILPTDPGIAPGFQYTTIAPPDDGEYTITNNMALWPYIFPTWLQIGDNSTDPKGYMMVVNASFTPGIFYEQTIDGLCDNTLYEFSADVINIIRQNVTNHILPNVSFLIDSIEEFTTGPIPQNETWRSYGFTFSTRPGQEQVTLTLRNNAPGGIGNDLALDNISFRPCGPPASISIDMEGRVCENTLYPTLSAIVMSDTGFVQWQISDDLGLTWSDITGATSRTYQSVQLSAHTYLFRYLYGNTPQHLQNEKCRIVSATRIVEVVPVNFTIIDTLCEGLSYNLGGTWYDSTGIYFKHLTALNGCDSIVTLYLTIVPDPGITINLASTPPRCTGGEDGTISVQNIQFGTPPYTLSILDQPGIPADQSLFVSSGTYDIIVSDRYGCWDSQNVFIEDPLVFRIDVTGDTALILGHTTTLDVSGNYLITSFQWDPPNGLSCTTCPVSVATPLTTTEYIVMAVSENGCIAIDYFVILVDIDPRLFIPNVFSPNGDQVNDTWNITADPLNVRTIEQVVIFDRWGNILNERSHISPVDVSPIWNGQYENSVVSAGVYVYLLEVRMANDDIVRLSGTITVVR